MNRLFFVSYLIISSAVYSQWLPVSPHLSQNMELFPGSVYADSIVIFVPTMKDNVFKSMDKGKTWMMDIFRRTNRSVKIIGEGNTKLMLSYDDKHGTFTTDNGGKWNLMRGIFSSNTVPVDGESSREGEFLVADKNSLRKCSASNFYTWLPVSFNLSTGESIKDLACFKNTNEYFVLTSHSELHYSNNLANGFTQRFSFSSETNLIEMVENSLMVALAKDSTGSKIFRSRNKGISWDSIRAPIVIRQLRMFTAASGIAVSNSNIVYYTSDSMMTWIASISPPMRETSIIKNNEAIGFDLSYRPFYSSDGGATWYQRSELVNTDIKGLAILSQNEMFLVKREGLIYRSGNYGYEWQAISDTVPGMVHSVVQESDCAFVIKTIDGRVFRFQQSPRLLIPITTPAETENRSIAAYNLIYLLYDNSSTIWVSDNRGENWSNRTLPAARHTNMVFARGKDIYIAQDSGYYLRSADLGLNWQQKKVSTAMGDRIIGIVGHGDSIFLATSVTNIHFTPDGGHSWRYNGTSVLRFFYSEPDHWYFLTTQMKLHSTTDFGATYQQDTGVGFTEGDITHLVSRGRAFGLMLNRNALMVRYAMGLPVEFTTFSAETVRSSVQLNWSTATETNNHGFFVQKNADGSWRDLAFIPGKGSTVSVNNYSFIDENRPATGEKVLYRLRQVDHSGEMSYSKEIEITGVPVELALGQNYPNPFNPVTVIRYALPARGSAINGFVELKVYNTAGELVKVLVNGEMPAGEHTVEFNAADLPSGIYFYRLETTVGNMSGKMLLLK